MTYKTASHLYSVHRGSTAAPRKNAAHAANPCKQHVPQALTAGLQTPSRQNKHSMQQRIASGYHFLSHLSSSDTDSCAFETLEVPSSFFLLPSSSANLHQPVYQSHCRRKARHSTKQVAFSVLCCPAHPCLYVLRFGASLKLLSAVRLVWDFKT